MLLHVMYIPEKKQHEINNMIKPHSKPIHTIIDKRLKREKKKKNFPSNCPNNPRKVVSL